MMWNGIDPSAAHLFRRFHGFKPNCARTVSACRIIPPVVVELGDLCGLIYRSDKWRPGRPHTYIHYMETPPKLVCNPEGSQLYIVGGNYRITAKGIEG